MSRARSLKQPRAGVPGTCPAGKVYYKCQTNGFDGCCTQDPCDELGPVPCVDDIVAPTSSSSVTADDSDSTTMGTTTTEPPTSIKTSTAVASPMSTDASTTDTSTTSAETTTLITSIMSTTDAAGLPTATTHTVLGPAPTSEAQNAEDDGPSSYNKTKVAGLSIGATIAGIFVLVVLFLLIRRQRIKMRQASIRGSTPFDEKSLMDQTQSSRGTDNGENDVFGPFGGRAASPRKTSPEKQLYAELDSKDTQRSASRGSSTKKPGSKTRDSVQPTPVTPLTPPSQSTSLFPAGQYKPPSPLRPMNHPRVLRPGHHHDAQLSLQHELGRAQYQRDISGSSNLSATTSERGNQHAMHWLQFDNDNNR
ncbi:Uu.00g014370.m01.CDS01 [Anthostomella pinea]|uniref:Uu.00g014370.m01.CDS01 n=1 Tax=Anthostomella pinea TaxID=933095 RepID=A0AAI8VZJ0_9PEZI|nr:Uu.00g014370.m01.CDS01 [Anthostomella pinea]